MTPSSANVLSAALRARVRLADSVSVRYGIGAVLDSVTPATPVNGDSVTAPVFGLLASTSYEAQVVAFNQCGISLGAVHAFSTGALPSDLPSYTAARSTPAPGYVVFAAGSYGIVIDNTGRVVWYHRFPNGPGLNFQPQPNGRYVARPSANTGGPARFVEIAPDGSTTRAFGCARNLPPRMHDVLVEPDGAYWVLCDETRTVDLSAQGAPAEALVLGTAIQKLSRTGKLLFEWSPFDHLAIDLGVLEAADRGTPVINWTHGNSIDLDTDGNLIVSFRNLSEVTKIDARTGAVLWRMGGTRNQLQFTNAGAPPFVRQHGVRAVGGGKLLLLDNLGEAAGSRAEQYEVIDYYRIVVFRGAYGSFGGFVAQVGGSTQPLGAGHTLVSYGSGGGVEEYDAAGNVVWKLTGNPGYVFRAVRIRSLYSPGVGDPR